MSRPVLILTAGFGEGHNAAARSLAAACAELGVNAEVIDLFAIAGGRTYQPSRRAYIGLINTAPWLWAALFRLIDLVPAGRWSCRFLRPMRDALAELVARHNPALILSVYPIYSYLIEEQWPDASQRPFAFHTIVTDSITVNSVWYGAPSDSFIVPNEDTARAMESRGVARGLIRVLGFPVPPRFARERPVRLTPPPPRVLFMVNAGKSRAPGIAARLLRIPGLHLTVTVGRDEALRGRIEAVAREAGRDVEIHGWTDRMPELLLTHHLLIGKAGGATVQEAIAAGTPMLVTQVVPGQEEGNARLLVENDCGAVCPTAGALARKVEELFSGEAGGWRKWAANIARLSRPDAAREIIRATLPAGIS